MLRQFCWDCCDGIFVCGVDVCIVMFIVCGVDMSVLIWVRLHCYFELVVLRLMYWGCCWDCYAEIVMLMFLCCECRVEKLIMRLLWWDCCVGIVMLRLLFSDFCVEIVIGLCCGGCCVEIVAFVLLFKDGCMWDVDIEIWLLRLVRLRLMFWNCCVAIEMLGLLRRDWYVEFVAHRKWDWW